MGKTSLAARLNCSVEEAQNLIDALFHAFPGLKPYIEKQQRYPFENNGHINTLLGDNLVISEWEQFCDPKIPSREKKGIEARIKRLAVNLNIQGNTSAVMAAGFFNNIRNGKNINLNLTPIIVVHDSNTNYIPVESLFDIKKFYDEHFTRYCHDVSKITLLFDLLVGKTYEDACEMKYIDDKNIEFTGNAHSLLQILEEINQSPKIKVACSMKNEDLIPMYINNPMERFIKEKGTSVIKDTSRYTIKLTKVS